MVLSNVATPARACLSDSTRHSTACWYGAAAFRNVQPRSWLQHRKLHSSRLVLRCAQGVQVDRIKVEEFRSNLRELDALLTQDGEGGEAKAVQLVAKLKQDGVVKAFGQAQQVPRRIYTLEELRLNRIEPEKYLSPEDVTLDGVRTSLQVAGVAGLTAAYFGLHLEFSQVIGILVGAFFLMALDQVALAGGLEALLIDTAGRVLSPNYAPRVAYHEAGHFLVAYLIGLLPRRYTLSSLDALRRYGALNVQAGTQFCDAGFQQEVASGRLGSSSLDAFCCVALAGVSTEYLVFGKSEGGLADVQQLDALLKALSFTQAKADGQIRWAVLNTTTILRRHRGLLGPLAESMSAGEPVSHCVALIESALADAEI